MTQTSVAEEMSFDALPRETRMLAVRVLAQRLRLMWADHDYTGLVEQEYERQALT